MNDSLESAVHALRTETSGQETGAGHYTRARVLAALRQKKRRRVLNVAFGIPLAAVLIGSGAWASQNGLPHWIERLTLTLGLGSAPSVPSALGLPPVRRTTPSASAKGAIALEQPAVSEPAAEAPTLAEPTENGSVEPAPNRSPSAGAARAGNVSKWVDGPATELELATYERAHRAHFVERHTDAALGAWDEYLRAFPYGRFALEAHYNRAVCLVRLGRYDAAKAALAPFASGKHAGYRQTEARALIQQLERTVP